MSELPSPSLPTTRYELPPEGISLLGYVVRRMHKTTLLEPVSALLAEGRRDEALAQVALYAAAASASFGDAYYQPTFNPVGDSVSEPDPATGARVTAQLTANRPHLRIAYTVEMPDGSRLEGTEAITGTTLGLGGLGMPAPAQMSFAAPGYTARLQGTIISELTLGLFRRTRVRAHGALQLSDSAGNTGSLSLHRTGAAVVRVSAPGAASRVWRAELHAASR